ncbi:MAG: hypothetical protein R3229_04700 [Alphaproteobacteria bacterium]|nr:hypothetical protein [Alphaproteobacteria bacterium]
MPPFAVGDVGEQEGLTVRLIDAAAKLPADQGMHFRILVDGLLDGDEKTVPIQGFDVFPKVTIGAVAGFHCHPAPRSEIRTHVPQPAGTGR